jgi:multicomponent Na+:H+ antiporter subunit E
VISLIPGSLVVEVDRSTSTLYLHALNIASKQDVEGLRNEVRSIEAGLIRIMGSPEELEAVRMEAAT